jgi:CBS domain containing-hemolysin-like protein
MDTTDVWLTVILVFLLVAAAYLAIAESALLRVSDVRAESMADSSDKRAVVLNRLLGRLPEVLNLILLLALLTQILAATITGVLAQRLFGSVGVTIASIVLTVVLYIYGEAIPKTYAVRHPDRSALLVARPISAMERLFRPLVRVLVWIADLQMPGKGIETSPTVTESELRLLVARAAREGEISRHDRVLIERAFRFGDRSADDAMIPRPDVVALSVDQDLGGAIATALRAGHRSLPVYEGSLDNIVGVVRLSDLITARESGGGSLTALVTGPLIVPESKHIAAILEDMRASDTHMAVVVDEYGVTAGILTVEDIAEELLGAISPGSGRPEIEKVADHRWLVAGSLPVEDLASIGLEVPQGSWNTVAGFMVGRAGRLLSPGEVVDLGRFRLEVTEASRRRVTRVAVEEYVGPSGPSS